MCALSVHAERGRLRSSISVMWFSLLRGFLTFTAAHIHSFQVGRDRMCSSMSESVTTSQIPRFGNEYYLSEQQANKPPILLPHHPADRTIWLTQQD